MDYFPGRPQSGNLRLPLPVLFQCPGWSVVLEEPALRDDKHANSLNHPALLSGHPSLEVVAVTIVTIKRKAGRG